MTLAVYPETPPPSFTYPLKDRYETIISERCSQNEQAQALRRFPARSFMVGYSKRDLGTEWNVIHDFHTARLGQWETFWFYDFLTRAWTDLKVGRGDGTTRTFDLPGKSIVSATLVVRVNDVIETHRSLSAGTGEGSSDQVIFDSGYAPADGSLITAAFTGRLRIKARKADEFSDKFDIDDVGDIEAFLIRSIE